MKTVRNTTKPLSVRNGTFFRLTPSRRRRLARAQQQRKPADQPAVGARLGVKRVTLDRERYKPSAAQEVSAHTHAAICIWRMRAGTHRVDEQPACPQAGGLCPLASCFLPFASAGVLRRCVQGLLGIRATSQGLGESPVESL